MTTYTHIASTTLYLGMCQTCDRPYRIDLGEGRTTLTQYVVTQCPGGCRMTVKFERLASVFTEEVCDVRCMGATGPSCSCACGGANHGAAWGTTATTYELESAVKALRARQEREEKAREARKAAKRSRKERIFAAWVAEGNQDVAGYLGCLDRLDVDGFLFDMVARVVTQEPLSDRQADAVRRIMTREAERNARQAAYEASKTTAPLGKGITVEGTIISVKDQPGYAYGTTDWKMTVECAGYRVWGSVPRSLIGNIITAGCYDRLKGQQVRFVAELVPSKGEDPSFVYFKRPTKAERLEPVGV